MRVRLERQRQDRAHQQHRARAPPQVRHVTINGNKIDETFVKWDEEKNKCFAGFTVSGNNVGIDESITVSGEALSFLSTGIDTRVYFIKNF